MEGQGPLTNLSAIEPLVFAGLASYLSGRAVATTLWYRAKFGKAWPAHRRHLVPFVF